MSNEKEKLLEEVYRKFLEASLVLPGSSLDGIEEIVDSRIMGYGTAADEKITSLPGYWKLINNSIEQGKGIDFSFEVVPVFRRTDSSGNMAIYVDEITLTMHVNGQTNSLLLRMTIILSFVANTWKVVHFHGSKPDENSSGEQDTWHLDEWKSRNAALEKMVAEKTADLEIKNRELEIETALERIRARAMAMQHSGELIEVANVMREQLALLGQHQLEAFVINQYVEGATTHDSWYAFRHNKNTSDQKLVTGIAMQTNDSCELMREVVNGYFSNKGEYLIEVKGEKLKEWYGVLATTIPEIWEEIKDSPYDTNYWYLTDFSGGSMLMVTITPPSEETKNIQKRCTAVFDLAFRRFLDLKKAEAQAREAIIEASLERVRAHAMGLRKTDELKNIISVIFEELQKIGLGLYECSIFLRKGNSREFSVWGKSNTDDNFLNNYQFNFVDHPVLNDVLRDMELKIPYREFYIGKKDLKSYGDLIFAQTDLKYASQDYKDSFYALDHIYAAQALFQHGILEAAGMNAPPGDLPEVLKRFSQVIDLAYTRFLDLQNAEAQAREAQIETCLERVRSRSLAMHHTSELQEVIHTVHKELLHLNIAINGGSFIAINNDIDTMLRFWGAGGTANTSEEVVLPKYDNPFCTNLLNGIKKGPGFFTEEFSQEEKIAFFTFLFKYEPWSKLDAKQQEETISTPGGYTRSCAVSKYTSIFIINHLGKIFPQEENDILKRFAKVFEQSYTRFLDLHKAEAQAREAQIEASLERLRSRSMAMHKSDELLQAGEILFVEMQKLGIESLTAGFVLIDKEEQNGLNYTPNPGTKTIMQVPVIIPHNETIHLQQVVENWKKGESIFIVELDEKETLKHQTFIAERSTNFPLTVSQLLAISPERVVLHNFYFKEGYILIVGGAKLTSEQTEIMLRFAKVFQQTYTRFLDLQKAEEQAREAQIEAALERVRSRTMGMQKSDELAETVSILFKQLLGLGINLTQLRTCGIATFNDDEPTGNVFMSDIDGDIISDSFEFRYDEAPSYKKIYAAWKSGEKHTVLHLTDKALVEHFSYIKKYSRVGNFTMEEVGKNFTEIYFHALFFSQGYLFIISYEPLTDYHDTFKRFGALFQQTYTRFLDFKKAEAQAREAQIEAALERVRSRSMAMHKSEELADLSFELVKQVHALGVSTWFCAFNITNEEEKNSIEWGSNAEGTYDKYITPRENVFLRYYEAGQKGEILHINEIGPEQCPEHYTYLCGLPGLGEQLIKLRDSGISFPKSQIDHVAYFKYGYILFITFEPVPESHDIFKRFAKVFEQTYIRFLDLQQAEAQAKEAQIEASLEKVRSRTLAMQKSDELAETAAEVFRQLIGLGIEPNRLYIGIVQDESGDMEMWATDEDGTHIGQRFIFNKNDNASVKKLYDGWKNKLKSVIVDMQGKELEEYFHYLNNLLHIPFKGGLSQERRVQSVAYFSKGFIGMASPDGQGNKTIQLLERFAAVFNLTFTRFNDLKIAEAHAEQAELDLILLKEEKKRTEDALNELQITQKQLIQSEKMASLGELTAGIAHEIQNPLNFVNNFSEVSVELVDEMNDEIIKGNFEDVREISEDLKQNLQKITHHGNRARDIVRGMLQHSRSSTGQKEPADINALCDEYLRLAYHGLRAKDKSFNASFETRFDDSIGTLAVQPQEIGRVILNLINNAFYAVAERKKNEQEMYEPKVIVITKKSGNNVIVTVHDNGTGIPQKVVDKIFQPFFTTKPTGQGTGLGLSLSYDIVKAHGGELRVETKEGNGTDFVIQLPIV